jgi:hypothetical protein
LWQPLAARTSAKQLEFILLKQRRVIRSFAWNGSHNVWGA